MTIDGLPTGRGLARQPPSEVFCVRMDSRISIVRTEILLLGDLPAARGVKMKKGLNIAARGVVLVVRWVDNHAHLHTPIYVVGNDEPDLCEKSVGLVDDGAW